MCAMGRLMQQSVLGTVALVGGSLLAFGVATPVSGQVTPRFSPAACAAAAAGAPADAPEGYIVLAPETTADGGETQCVLGEGGTYIYTKTLPNGKVKVKSRVIKTKRGDVGGARQAKVYFIRKNTVITVPARVRSGQVSVKQKLPRNGRWAVVTTYKSVVISTVVRVFDA